MKPHASYVFLILLMLLFLAGLWAFFFNPSQEQRILAAIEQANYCTVKSDCVQVDSQCPFGCYVFVNKGAADRIEGMIQQFDSTCDYSCLELESYDCVQGKCVASYD